MKESKSLLLVLLALAIVATWIYHIYDKKEYRKQAKVVYVPETPVKPRKDSLKTELLEIVSDSAKGVEAKLEGIVILRNEISRMLDDPNLSRTDLHKAGEKIKILQQNLSALSTQTDSLTKEIAKATEDSLKKLNSKQIAKDTQTAKTKPALVKQQLKPDNRKTIDSSRKDILPVYNAELTFRACELSIRALNELEPNQRESTSDARKTKYIAVSFVVWNNAMSFNNTAIYLVLTDPAGNVIQDDLWEAGITRTRNDGQVRFTRKINIEYSKGDTKKVEVSIPTQKLSRGSYKVLLYHNTQFIGKTDLLLN